MTEMNAESSRSHLVIGIVMESTSKSTGNVMKGKVSEGTILTLSQHLGASPSILYKHPVADDTQPRDSRAQHLYVISTHMHCMVWTARTLQGVD